MKSRFKPRPPFELGVVAARLGLPSMAAYCTGQPGSMPPCAKPVAARPLWIGLAMTRGDSNTISKQCSSQPEISQQWQITWARTMHRHAEGRLMPGQHVVSLKRLCLRKIPKLILTKQVRFTGHLTFTGEHCLFLLIFKRASIKFLSDQTY